MLIDKSDTKWALVVEPRDNQLGLINIIRNLYTVNEELSTSTTEGLDFEFDLANLGSANSELIAQFVNIQMSLVRHNGRLRIVNANPDLKSVFDVVMLDKIINIQYLGQDESDNSDDEYAEE
ncbi:MAG: hypothetical protein ABUK01_12055 [Leptospirales bacterium]